MEESLKFPLEAPSHYLLEFENEEKAEFKQLQDLQLKLGSINLGDCEEGKVLNIGSEAIIVEYFHKETKRKLVAKMFQIKKNLSKDSNEYKILTKLPPHKNIIFPLNKIREKIPIEILDLCYTKETLNSEKNKALLENTTEIIFYNKYENNLETFISNNRNKMFPLDFHEILFSIGEGLLHLQENKIEHGDLNLTNILIDNKGKILICDFGEAFQIENDDFTICSDKISKQGNWLHKADEIRNPLLQIYNYSKQSSFAFGCLMYEILFGIYPFEYGLIGDVFRNKISDKLMDKFSWYLPLINRLLCVDPNDRLSLVDSIQILQNPFQSRVSLSYFRKQNLKSIQLPSYELKEINNDDFNQWKELADKNDDLNSQYKLAVSLPDKKERNYYLQLLLDKNHPVAQCIQGIYYFTGGDDFNEDYDEALRFFLLSANQNFAQGLTNASFVLYEQKKENEKMKLLNKLARMQGNHASQRHYITIQMESGKRDYKNILRFCTKASNQNDLVGKTVLSSLYRPGTGIKQNNYEIFRIIKIASKQNSDVAALTLVECYVRGIGTEVNYKKALRLLKNLTDKNDKFAQFALATYYLEGRIVEKNNDEGLRLLKLSAKQNYNLAQFALYKFFVNVKNSKFPKHKAVKNLKLSADNGLAEAQFELSIYYEDEKQFPEAFKYLELASANGHNNATSNLAVCYLTGDLVEKDIMKGIEILKNAADNGNASAQRKLGICYLDGVGVDKDYEKGVSYFKLSAEGGNIDAMLWLSYDYREKNEYDKAFDLCKKVADNGNAKGLYELALCYRDGVGIEQDIDEYIRYLKLAVSTDGNFKPAIKALETCKRYHGNQVNVVKIFSWSVVLFTATWVFWLSLPRSKFWRY